MLTDGRVDMTKLIVSFHNFVNVPKNLWRRSHIHRLNHETVRYTCPFSFPTQSCFVIQLNEVDFGVSRDSVSCFLVIGVKQSVKNKKQRFKLTCTSYPTINFFVSRWTVTFWHNYRVYNLHYKNMNITVQAVSICHQFSFAISHNNWFCWQGQLLPYLVMLIPPIVSSLVMVSCPSYLFWTVVKGVTVFV
jgi:hypothetical protein